MEANEKVKEGELVEITGLAIYSQVESDLAHYKKINNVVFDYNDPEGNKQARSHVAKMRTVKGDISRAYKTGSEKLQASLKVIKNKEKELISEMDELIQVHAAPIKEIEEKEEARVAKLQESIDVLTSHAGVDPNLDSTALAKVIEAIENLTIDEIYEERMEEAATLKEYALNVQKSRLADVEKSEAEKRELEELRMREAEREKAELERRSQEAKELAEKQEKEREARIRAEQLERKIAELKIWSIHEYDTSDSIKARMGIIGLIQIDDSFQPRKQEAEEIKRSSIAFLSEAFENKKATEQRELEERQAQAEAEAVRREQEAAEKAKAEAEAEQAKKEREEAERTLKLQRDKEHRAMVNTQTGRELMAIGLTKEYADLVVSALENERFSYVKLSMEKVV